MKKYNEFINSKLNEEFIGGVLKKLLGSLVQNIKDELKKPLEDFSNKLSNEKSTEGMIKIVNMYLTQHKEELNKTLEESTTAPAVVKTVEDNLRTAYASIKASVENFGKEKYTFEEIFKDVPERTKKLFDKNEKNFDKNVNNFSKDLILSFGKAYGLNKEDLEQTPEEAKTEEEQGKIQSAAPEGDTPEGTAPTEHLHTDYKDKLFEAIKEEDLVKLKADIIKWFDNTIYKHTTNSLEEVKKGGTEKPTDDIEAKINAISGEVTNNKDSVRSIMNKITELDKQTLMKVRDLIGLDKNETPL